MYRTPRNIPLVAVPLLVAVAGVGYLAGNHRVATSAGAAFGKQTRYASVANIQLEYPSSWSQATGGGGVPDLQLEAQVVFAPAGDSAPAGLVAGELPSGEPNLLPARFLAALRTLPRTEVLNDPGGQAYRYSHVSLSGYPGTVEVTVVPSQEPARETVLACYATTAAAAALSQCAQMAMKFSLLGEPQYDLTPDAGFAHTLASVLGTLETERMALRRRLAQGPTPKSAGVIASALAERFATAARALQAVEAPAIAGPTASAFAAAALRARDAYYSLAAAVNAESNPRYAAALESIDTAEAAVNGALEGFALLGYNFS